MNLQVIKNQLLFWGRKILFYGVFIFIVLFTAAFFILQIPAVQTALTSRYLKNFSQITGFPATIGHTNLKWYDRLALENVSIKDPEGNGMITVNELNVNFEFTSLLANHNVNIDGVELKGADVRLIRIKETDTTNNLNINIFIKRINDMSAGGSGQPSSAKLNIGEILLEKSKFMYNEADRDSIKNGFDYRHFNLAIDDGDILDFQVIGDTIQFDVNTLQIVDQKSKLAIKDLQTYFRISQSSMEFLGLNLKAGKSIVSDTIIFKYNSQDDLSDFNTKVNIIAKLKSTVLDPEELKLFSYGLPPIPQPITLNGSIRGKVSKFSFRDMDVAMGNTLVRGRLDMDGLPNINETFIDLIVRESVVDQEDLRFVLPENIYDLLQPLGRIKTSGEFTGFVNDFVANGKFDGRLGKIQSDVNLKIKEKDIENSSFAGNLSLINFDLGTYLQDTTNFQRINLKGNIRGKGLDLETTDFNLTGNVQSLGFRHYNYTGISTNARFAKQLFNGNVSIDDKNLSFKASGFIDFRKGNEIIRINANLDTAVVHELGLVKVPLLLRADCEINTNGLELDSLVGSIILRNARINYKNRELELDSVKLYSAIQHQEHYLQLKSSLADAKLEGSFRYKYLAKDMSDLFKEVNIILKNDKTKRTAFNKSKNRDLDFYQAKLSLKVNDISPLTNLFIDQLYVSPHTEVQAQLIHGPYTGLVVNAQSDTVIFQKKIFSTNRLDFSGAIARDSGIVSSVLKVNSANQNLAKSFKTQDLFAQAEWVDDHIDFTLNADQTGNSNILRLKSELNFLEDSIKLKILTTRLRIFNEEWTISSKNYALVKEKEWQIHQLRIHRGAESVMLEGYISENPSKSLNLNVDSLNIDILNTILAEKIGGNLNGVVQARDLYHSPYIQNNVSIDSLTVDNFLVGNLSGTNIWNHEKQRFDINFKLERLGKQTVLMDGYYNPALELPLFVKAKLENTNIKIIEPFLTGIFSQMDGELTGDYTISGTFLQPKIEGNGKIEGGKLMIDYLKTKYNFSGSLGFTPKQISFKDFSLTDALGHQAQLEGFLEHKNYSDFRINLNASFNNFQLLNTAQKDNNLFYGQAYGTGELNILGSLRNMKISATARSEKSTRIFIPLGRTSETNVAKKDFITFVKFADTLKTTNKKAKSQIKEEPSGITMDMNLDITPDAYTEIIFDIKSGDIIRGYGRGDLKLQLDTKGEFNMFGSYEFERGNYNFTLYDIINKEFTINKGGRITWFGDPYTAMLSMTASYRQLASIAPIIPNLTATELSSASLKRKFPVEVLLKIEGQMMAPQITFDILANDLPNVLSLDGSSTTISPNLSFKAFRAKLDEQELQKQVFSLIVLRRFSALDAFTASGSISSSVSELLSNQLSYWLTQVDQNLEIDFDLGNFDQEAFNTFQLRLSYSFLNGRLRVTRDGTFNNQYARSEVANMLGDWTVDYLLTPDGKFKVKMYNRTNVNQLANSSSSFNQQTAITTGFSLLNTQNFNTWRELLTSSRERRRRELAKQKKEEKKEAKPDDGTE
jgi:hypothetical protein